MADFTGQNIQDTYQRVVQVDGNQLQDGTGSNLPISFNGDDVIIPGAIRAQSYIISQSIIAISSGSSIFGNSFDDTHTFSGSVSINDKVDTDYNTITPSLFVRQDAVDRSQIANGFGGSIDFNIQRGSNSSGARTGRIASYLVTGQGTVNDQWGMKFGIRNDDTQLDAITIYPGDPDSAAMVGIMDTTPSHTLDVNGTIRAVSNISSDSSISATGNISASGAIIGNRLQTDDYITGDTSLPTGILVDGYVECNHITASGNISSSATITANIIQTPRINGTGGSLYIANSMNVAGGNHITASGNISSSGDIISSKFILNNDTVEGASLSNSPGVFNIKAGNGGTLDSVGFKSIKTTFIDTVHSDITASGDISASGTIEGSNLSGTNTGDQDLSGYVLSSITSSLLVRNSETGSFLTSVPTGTLSSSLQLPEGTVSSSLQLPTGIFSASFGNLRLPHNGEVGYDSDNHILFGSTQVKIDSTIFNVEASNRINFFDSNVGINPAGSNLVAPERLTVGGNISASGNFIGQNFIGQRVNIAYASSNIASPTQNVYFYAGSNGLTSNTWNVGLSTADAPNAAGAYTASIPATHFNNIHRIPCGVKTVTLKSQNRVGHTQIPSIWIYTGSFTNDSADDTQMGFAASQSIMTVDDDNVTNGSGKNLYNIDITGSKSFTPNPGHELIAVMMKNEGTGTQAWRFNYRLDGITTE